jgi:hypothetical protein
MKFNLYDFINEAIAPIEMKTPIQFFDLKRYLGIRQKITISG